MDTAEAIEFSDISKAVEESTGIPDIDLFPAIRKWKTAQQAEKIVAVIPVEIRAAVAKKLIGSLIAGLFGRKK